MKLYKIETAEQIEALAEAAARTHDDALLVLRDVMTPERCAFVREQRIRDGDVWGSWRYVAEICHDAWGASWSPPSNQSYGMALCQIAAEHFGEDYMEPPWN